MRVAAAIIKNKLSTEGGVYRQMPLFSLSCIGEGYGRYIRHVTGMTYGKIGGIGNATGMQTLYAIDTVIGLVAKKIRTDRSWVPRITKAGSRLCYQFNDALARWADRAAQDPAGFIRFAIRQYPVYLAGIGAYNFLWRYVEFAPRGATRLPKKTLHRLAAERNELAKIYPRCELLLKIAARAVAVTMGLKPALLLAMTRTELAPTISTQRLAVSKQELSKRAHQYLYFFSAGKESVSTAPADIRAVTKHIHLALALHGRSTIVGRPVSPGKVTGVVVTNWRRTSWPRRPIYVTAMTHPQEIPYLKKAVAIVTDEGGGILSHAAIVSRELGIPCIIGTKVATRVLKDGDRIEVDATKGIVRKL